MASPSGNKLFPSTRLSLRRNQRHKILSIQIWKEVELALHELLIRKKHPINAHVAFINKLGKH